jgi:hypothetical protein
MSRRVVEALRGLRERQRFMKGLFAWVGFPQVSIPYERQPRIAGKSKFNYWRLWNFALEGITGFSTAPLRVATYLGLGTALLSFGYGAWIVTRTLLWGDPVQGWPTMMVVVLFLGGVQLMALGVIGEYLGRLYLKPSSGLSIWFGNGYPGRVPRVPCNGIKMGAGHRHGAGKCETSAISWNERSPASFRWTRRSQSSKRSA